MESVKHIQEAHLPILFLAALIFFHIAVNIIFLYGDAGQEGNGDLADCRQTGAWFYCAFSGHHFPETNPLMDRLGTWTPKDPLGYFRNTYECHLPPLTFILSGLSNMAFGPSVAATTFPGTLYLALLLMGVFGIGTRLKDRATGLTAAVLTGFFPVVYGLSRTVKSDLGMAAFVALSIWASLDGLLLTSWMKSTALGIFIGLGLLTHSSFPLFFLPAFFWLLWKVHLKGVIRRKNVSTLPNRQSQIGAAVGCLGVILAVSGAIASIYYNAGHFRLIFLQYSMDVVGLAAESRSRFSFFDPVYYLRSLVYSQISWPFALALLPGALLVWRSDLKHKPMLILWMAIPFIFFSFTRLKFDRYLVSSIPVLAIAFSAGFQTIPRKSLRAALIATAFAAGAAVYLWISFFRVMHPLADDLRLVTSSGSTSEYILTSHGGPDCKKAADWLFKTAVREGADAVVFKSVLDHPKRPFDLRLKENFRYKIMAENAAMEVIEPIRQPGEKKIEKNKKYLLAVIGNRSPASPRPLEERLARWEAEFPSEIFLMKPIPVATWEKVQTYRFSNETESVSVYRLFIR